MKSDIWLAYLCFLGLPALAIGLIAFFAYQSAVTTGTSPLLAVIIGIVLGIIILAVMITASGHDMMDFAVTSIIVIVLTIIMMPVFMRAREKSHARNAIRKALRERGAIYPQPMKKGTQPNG